MEGLRSKVGIAEGGKTSPQSNHKGPRTVVSRRVVDAGTMTVANEQLTNLWTEVWNTIFAGILWIFPVSVSI